MPKFDVNQTNEMAFKIPLQSEVQAYIQEKKGWPEKFCKYYAEKFWSHYQSNGWKVSGKAPMKDWKAAFCANWQTPKFLEDINFLNACLRTNERPAGGPATIGAAPGPTTDGNLMYMDEVMAYYGANHCEIEDIRLASCYDTLKGYGLMRLTKDESNLIKTTYGADMIKGKAGCVKILFDKLITRGITLKELYAKSNKPAANVP